MGTREPFAAPPPPVTLADVARIMVMNHAELRGQLAASAAEVARLAGEVARLASRSAGRPLAPGEEAMLRALFPLVYAILPAREFSSAELVAIADTTPHIKRALGHYAANTRKLGRLLMRATQLATIAAGYTIGVVPERSPRVFAVFVSNPLETPET